MKKVEMKLKMVQGEVVQQDSTISIQAVSGMVEFLAGM